MRHFNKLAQQGHRLFRKIDHGTTRLHNKINQFTTLTDKVLNKSDKVVSGLQKVPGLNVALAEPLALTKSAITGGRALNSSIKAGNNELERSRKTANQAHDVFV